ncbi:MAG: PIN domain-containing protein [archaeon]
MESAVKIALDANMLLAIEQFKLCLKEEIDRVLPRAELAVPDQVIEELEKLAFKSKALEKQVKIALQFLKSEKVKTLKWREINADKALLGLSKNGFIIATNDKALRKSIKKNSGKCLILRKKKYLILE